jgi:ABC-type branched-subunit amino acid transport system substrate-binding protein
VHLSALHARPLSSPCRESQGWPAPATGDHGLRELRFNAERINARGGILGQKIEVVAMDNKLSAPESLALLQRAIDEGIRYIIQGNGSSVAAALIDGGRWPVAPASTARW